MSGGASFLNVLRERVVYLIMALVSLAAAIYVAHTPGDPDFPYIHKKYTFFVPLWLGVISLWAFMKVEFGKEKD